MISEGQSAFRTGDGCQLSVRHDRIEGPCRHSNASRARSTATACRSPTRRTLRHSALRIQRRRDRRPLPRSGGGLPRISAQRCTTRSRRTRRWASRACCAASAPPPTPTRSARSTSRCAPASRRRRSSSPASARRMRSSSAPSASGCAASTPSRKGRSSGSTRIAAARGVKARVAVRVNPDIDARSHPHISTGLKNNKFGVAIDDAREMCLRMRGRERRADRRTAQPRRLANHRARAAPARRRGAGRPSPPSCAAPASPSSTSTSAAGSASLTKASACRPRRSTRRACCRSSARAGLDLILEPGRFIVGTGRRCSSPEWSTSSRRRAASCFVIVDAGMTELMRPMLYGAYHRIEPVQAGDRPPAICDIVGPMCETTDTLGKDRRLPRPEVGDLLVVFDAGAYGAVMASNYNRRPMPAEVLVQDGEATVDQAPSDDRRSLRARELTRCGGFSSPSKGSIRAASRHRPRRYGRADRRRALVRAAVVSRLSDRHRRRDPPGAARRARVSGRRDAAALRGQPLRDPQAGLTAGWPRGA